LNDAIQQPQPSAVHVSGIGFFSNEGEILLHLRDAAPGLDQAGKWALIGGHIEEGETPREALLREVEEELGLKSIAFEEILRLPAGSTKYYLHYGMLPVAVDDLRLSEGQAVRFFSINDALSLENLTDVARLFLWTIREVNAIRSRRGFASLFGGEVE
jgi:8-oxo-dGTP diphosphatase